MIQIYHNPRCTKSREALQLLNEQNLDIEIIEYLKTPLAKEKIKELIQTLGIQAEDLVRKEEALYKEKYKGKAISGEEWISIMAEHPVLIQRPIIIKGKKGVIARPLENLIAFLK